MADRIMYSRIIYSRVIWRIRTRSFAQVECHEMAVFKELKRAEKKGQNELGRELVRRENILDELAAVGVELDELHVRRTRLDDRLAAHRERLKHAAPADL